VLAVSGSPQTVDLVNTDVVVDIAVQTNSRHHQSIQAVLHQWVNPE